MLMLAYLWSVISAIAKHNLFETSSVFLYKNVSNSMVLPINVQEEEAVASVFLFDPSFDTLPLVVF